MKKLMALWAALLLVGMSLQGCKNQKTYAEMLDEERDAVRGFLQKNDIKVISQEAFLKDTVTRSKEAGASVDEFAELSNGVYLQVIRRGESGNASKFKDGDEITVRYLEENISTGQERSSNVFRKQWEDVASSYVYPSVFRYVDNGVSTAYGIFTEQDPLWASMYNSTSVPPGWLMVLPYLRNQARVRLIVSSKMGHTAAQNAVHAYYYYIESFAKAKS